MRALAFVDFRQCAQRIVEANDVGGARGRRHFRDLVDRDPLETPPLLSACRALARSTSTRAHESRGHREEVRAVLPRHLAQIDEAQNASLTRAVADTLRVCRSPAKHRRAMRFSSRSTSGISACSAASSPRPQAWSSPVRLAVSRSPWRAFEIGNRTPDLNPDSAVKRLSLAVSPTRTSSGVGVARAGAHRRRHAAHAGLGVDALFAGYAVAQQLLIALRNSKVFYLGHHRRIAVVGDDALKLGVLVHLLRNPTARS